MTGRNKSAIEDHFDIAFELNDTLERRGKTTDLEALAKTSPSRPDELHPTAGAAGPGHAVWCAREIVGDEPFAVLLPDMLSRGSMEQMLAAYERHGGNIIAVEEVPPDQTQYGIVSVGEEFGRTFEITGMVEKPRPAPRRRTTSFQAATSCSPRSSTSCRTRKRARAARSSSPTP